MKKSTVQKYLRQGYFLQTEGVRRAAGEMVIHRQRGEICFITM